MSSTSLSPNNIIELSPTYTEIIKAIYSKLTAIDSDSDSAQQAMNRLFVQEVKRYTGSEIRINPC